MLLLKNITRVLFANTVTLISNLLVGLILPIFLSVSEFGEYRLFLLYASYVGLLHFGFIDAIYLKYGGFESSKVDKRKLKKERAVYFYYQFCIALISLLIGVIFNDYMYILIGVMIIAINNGSFHKLYYQATGQFRKYSKIHIIFSILNLFMITILLFCGSSNASHYIVVTLLSHFLILFIMEIDFKKYTQNVKPEGEVKILAYNKVGVFILLGNLGIMFITNLGLWTVHFLFEIEKFAIYAFSIAMMNMVLLLINSVGLTFYNYISKKINEEELNYIKSFLIIVGALGSSIYFIFDPIVHWVLPKYIESLSIIAISFMVFPYLIVTNVIIINLFKARKQQKKFLNNVLAILCVGIILTMLFFSISQTMESIALATYFTFVIWYLYATMSEFKFLKGTMTEISFLIIHGLVFYYAAHYLSWFNGLTIYLLIIIFSSFIVLRRNGLMHFLKSKLIK